MRFAPTLLSYRKLQKETLYKIKLSSLIFFLYPIKEWNKLDSEIRNTETYDSF